MGCFKYPKRVRCRHTGCNSSTNPKADGIALWTIMMLNQRCKLLTTPPCSPASAHCCAHYSADRMPIFMLCSAHQVLLISNPAESDRSFGDDGPVVSQPRLSSSLGSLPSRRVHLSFYWQPACMAVSRACRRLPIKTIGGWEAKWMQQLREWR